MLPPFCQFGASKGFGIEEDQMWREYHAKIGRSSSSKLLQRLPTYNYTFSHIKDSRVGRIDNQGIGLWSGLDKESRTGVLRHEVGHQFLEQLCPGRVTVPFLHEVFAQWISGDFARVASSSTEFAYGHLALDWLKGARIFGKQSATDVSQMSYGVGRILLENFSSKRLEEALIRVTQGCLDDDFDGKLAAQQVLSALLDSRMVSNISKKSPEILVIDGISLEPLIKQGSDRVGFGPGSILKPILVGMIKEFRLSASSTSSAYWRCGSFAHNALGPQMWTWMQALVQSCNGFFLEHQHADTIDFRPWLDLINQFGIKHGFRLDDFQNNKEILLKSIGLIPGIEITLEQVAGLYRWLYDVAPDVMHGLLKTPIEGTLRGHPQSRWFIDHGFALKTGTVRAISSEPLHGWVVAVGSIKENPDNPPVIAVVHGVGHSPQDLLPFLERSLKSMRLGDSPKEGEARVQILGGLVHPGSFQASCMGQLYRVQELPLYEKIGSFRPKFVTAVPATLLKLNQKALYTCYQGPLSLTSDKTSDRVYSYYGRLRVDPLKVKDPTIGKTLPVSPRRAGARLGSSLIIETSLQHYINNVISNEYPEGYKSTLQALALSVALNSRSNRHEGRPVCDTSHCQIFGGRYPHGVMASKQSQKSRIFDASRWAMGELDWSQRFQGGQLGRLCSALDWYPFSIGGHQPWTQVRSPSQIAQALNLALPLYHIKIEGDVEITHLQGVTHLKCEVFRNQLSLPSCPRAANLSGDRVTFQGRGDGHGMGLSLVEADLLAAKGTTVFGLLSRFFPELPAGCLSQTLFGG